MKKLMVLLFALAMIASPRFILAADDQGLHLGGLDKDAKKAKIAAKKSAQEAEVAKKKAEKEAEKKAKGSGKSQEQGRKRSGKTQRIDKEKK